MLTKEELLVAADAADVWPVGHASDWEYCGRF
jgi:hypothetical protein